MLIVSRVARYNEVSTENSIYFFRIIELHLKFQLNVIASFIPRHLLVWKAHWRKGDG